MAKAPSLTTINIASTDKKIGGGANKHITPGAHNFKLDSAGDVTEVYVPKVTKDIADKIQQKRQEMKLTQVEVAHRAAIDVKYVKDYERVGSVLESKYLQKIARVLGVPLRMPPKPKKAAPAKQ